jgi:hypothetical protein
MIEKETQTLQEKPERKCPRGKSSPKFNEQGQVSD